MDFTSLSTNALKTPFHLIIYAVHVCFLWIAFLSCAMFVAVIVYCRRALRSKLEPLTSISIYILIFYAMSGMRFHFTLCSVHGTTLDTCANGEHTVLRISCNLFGCVCVYVFMTVCNAHKMQFSNFQNACFVSSCFSLFILYLGFRVIFSSSLFYSLSMCALSCAFPITIE